VHNSNSNVLIGKDNHTVQRCSKKQKDDQRSGNKNELTDFMLVSIDDLLLSTSSVEQEKCHEICAGYPDTALKVIPSIQGSKWNRSYGHHIWILDSGSTSHMRFTLDRMTDLVPCKSPITCGNREIICSEQKGTFQGQVVSKHGTEFYVILEDVLHVP
jgi:hypothetical protein